MMKDKIGNETDGGGNELYMLIGKNNNPKFLDQSIHLQNK